MRGGINPLGRHNGVLESILQVIGKNSFGIGTISELINNFSRKERRHQIKPRDRFQERGNGQRLGAADAVKQGAVSFCKRAYLLDNFTEGARAGSNNHRSKNSALHQASSSEC